MFLSRGEKRLDLRSERLAASVYEILKRIQCAEEEIVMRNKLISLLVLISVLFSFSMSAMAEETSAAEHPVINDGNPITLTITRQKNPKFLNPCRRWRMSL